MSNADVNQVLWTIPVQLQFSFVTLLATVMIKDIKKPWKRMGFYSFAIICGWYATVSSILPPHPRRLPLTPHQSWSACHWLGLLLADVDITYDWRRKIQARWYTLYPAITCGALLALGAPLVLLFNSSVIGWSFMSWENAIHPETMTGRPIYETTPSIWYAYPEYYAPSLAVLVFSFGLQVVVELSVWVQKALSIRLVTFFHPHIMTIYRKSPLRASQSGTKETQLTWDVVIHGFIFWSLGAYVAVAMSDLGLPYWGILMVTAVVCYATIMVATVFITPLIEFATRGAIKNLVRWATEDPVPHRPTTAPFPKDLIVGREPDEPSARPSLERRPSQQA
jgi:hypothetical protein